MTSPMNGVTVRELVDTEAVVIRAAELCAEIVQTLAPCNPQDGTGGQTLGMLDARSRTATPLSWLALTDRPMAASGEQSI